MLVRRLRFAVAMLAIATLGVAFADAEARFLVFHVDAVPAADFERAFEEGRLPNVTRAFAGGTYRRALTLFPASTPMIYPRLHSGHSNAEGDAIGFGGFDRACERPVGELEVLLGLIDTFPRRAVTTLLYGVPGLDACASLAMQNVPALLERYAVVEFLWFSTDTYGHLFGADAHARSLERFDAALGSLLPRLDLEQTNLVLYGDHGLTFCDDTVDLDALYEARVGADLRHVAYPNLYLHDAADAGRVARALAAPGGVDYAFHRSGADRVEGYVDGRWVAFVAEGEAIAYRSDGDPLGYAALGYDGAALTPDAWLALTVDARFPATPANLYRYLQHPGVGDVVAGVNPPRIPQTVRANRGNHAGIVATDLLVPVLVRGAAFDHLADERPIWLHTLFEGVEAVTAPVRPPREAHVFGVTWCLEEASATAQLAWSPEERRRLAFDIDRDGWRAWADVDVASTYLTRWWLGAGVAYEASGAVIQPMVCARMELDLADARVSVQGTYAPDGWTVGVGLSLRVVEGLRVAWRAPATIGIALEW